MGDVTTTKYVRKPLYVEAVQVTKENFADVLKWANGDLGVVGAAQGDDIINAPTADDLLDLDYSKHYIRVRVNNPQSPRQTRASVGDWILYTDRGYKIYTDKAFKDNFVEVGSEEASPA